MKKHINNITLVLVVMLCAMFGWFAGQFIAHAFVSVLEWIGVFDDVCRILDKITI